jgi:hypothetical protein
MTQSGHPLIGKGQKCLGSGTAGRNSRFLNAAFQLRHLTALELVADIDDGRVPVQLFLLAGEEIHLVNPVDDAMGGQIAVGHSGERGQQIDHCGRRVRNPREGIDLGALSKFDLLSYNWKLEIRVLCKRRTARSSMPDQHQISFLVGAILLAVGIVGGGFEVKEIKVPKVGGLPRFLSAVFGVVFVMFGMNVRINDVLPNILEHKEAEHPSDPSSPPPNRAYWEVDKSLVYLESTGSKKQFFFVDPSQDMLSRGVKPGTLLFEGSMKPTGDTSDGKTGEMYAGTIFVYFAKCPTQQYDAQGPVLHGPTVELVGNAPRVDNASCKPIGVEEKKLVFDFKEKK